MNDTPNYTDHLENLVAKMLPIYNKYFALTGEPRPELDAHIVSKINNKIPALFKPFGDLTFASNERKPRKN